MAGTKEGAEKARETNLKRYGSDFYSKIGKKGQESYLAKPKEERKPRGFASMSPERRSELGRKGGSKSRRGRDKDNNTGA